MSKIKLTIESRYDSADSESQQDAEAVNMRLRIMRNGLVRTNKIDPNVLVHSEVVQRQATAVVDLTCKSICRILLIISLTQIIRRVRIASAIIPARHLT
jgi:hypothetical protein